jgi:hypothetical protein
MKFLIVSILMQSATGLHTTETRTLYETTKECTQAKHEAARHLEALNLTGAILGFALECSS